MPDWLALIVGMLLTIGTGLFVASEFALVNLDRNELEARRARGEKFLTPTIRALKHTSTHLSSAQLGITLTTLLTGYIWEPAISAYLISPLTSWGLAEAAVRPTASVIAVTIATLLSMIVGELVPKNFALALPRGTAIIVVPFQLAFTFIFKPAIVALNETANAILRAIGIEPKEELSSARTAEELRSLVQHSATVGSLDFETAELLARTLIFSEHTAADVMTPRTSLASIAREESAASVIELARTTGFSRFPVTEDGIDEIVGLVHLKNAVAVPRERRPEVPVSALSQEALRVPETLRLDALLGQLRGRGLQMAVVVDEYGGTAGVVTLEDLVEELVGEVADEHDRSRAGVTRHGDAFVFPGRLRPDELLDRTGIRVPDDGPYETVAGYLMNELGHLPSVGETLAVEGGIFRVERLDGRRIDRIRYTPAPVDEGESA